MALSTKNRKWVVGALIVGTLGGGGLVVKGIDFGGSAAKAGAEQLHKVAPAVPPLIDDGGDIMAKGVDNLGKTQDALNRLDAKTTTTTAPAGAPAAPGPAGNPDS